MSETYFRIRMSNVSTPKEQELTNFCFEHKALGLSEVLSFTQPDLTYDPSLISRRILELDVFFEVKPPEIFFPYHFQSSLSWAILRPGMVDRPGG